MEGKIVAAGTRRTRYRWVVICCVVFVWFLITMDRASVPAVLPYIRAEFGIDHDAAGLLMSLYMLMWAATQLFAGILTDRLGTKNTLRIAVVAVIATALSGLAGVYAILLATRILLGFGQAHFWAPANRAVGQWTGPRERGRGTVLMLLAASSGASIAPPLAALTISFTGSWRPLFWELAAGGVLAAILLQRFFFDTPQDARARGRIDLAELQHIGSKAPPPGKQERAPIGDLVRDPMLWVISWVLFFNVSIFMVVMAWTVSFLREQQGLDVVTAGLLAGIPTTLVFCTSPLGGWVVDRFGLIRLTIFVSSAGLVPVLYLLAIAPRSLPLVALLLVLLGIFMGLSTAPIYSYQMRRYPPTMLGRAAGISGSISGFGAFVTPLITGYLVTGNAGTYSYYGVFLFVMLLGAMGAIAGLFLSPKPFRPSTS